MDRKRRLKVPSASKGIDKQRKIKKVYIDVWLVPSGYVICRSTVWR
jgi:hypothetical protein